MVAEPSGVRISSADVSHRFAKAMAELVQAFPLAAHASCHRPWSWSSRSTVQANVSPVSGLTARVPRYMGQAGDPVVVGRVGQSAGVKLAPGCAERRVHSTPSADW